MDDTDFLMTECIYDDDDNDTDDDDDNNSVMSLNVFTLKATVNDLMSGK